jgi:competence protein ComEC
MALVLSPVPGLSVLIGTIFAWLIWLMNSIIHIIEGLPYSTLHGIFINFNEMILLYLLTGAIFLYFFSKKKGYLYGILTVLIMLQFSALHFRIKRLNQASFVVYNVPGAFAIDFIIQDQSCLVFHCRDSIEALPAFISDIATNNANAQGVSRRSIYPHSSLRKNIDGISQQLRLTENFYQFRNIRLAILNERIPRSLKRYLNVDYLIITGNPDLTISRIVSVYKTSHIIIDGSNSLWKTRKWCREAEVLGIKIHAAIRNGAFVKEI